MRIGRVKGFFQKKKFDFYLQKRVQPIQAAH